MSRASTGSRCPTGSTPRLAVQYADQRTVGANLTNGGIPYQTDEFGARLEFGYRTGILTVGYSTVNPTFAMANPWSSNPVYTDSRDPVVPARRRERRGSGPVLRVYTASA